MTVRELINLLMNLNLDKPVFITEFDNKDNEDKTIGYVEFEGIHLSDYVIKDVDIHGVYGDYYNCITINKNKGEK